MLEKSPAGPPVERLGEISCCCFGTFRRRPASSCRRVSSSGETSSGEGIDAAEAKQKHGEKAKVALEAPVLQMDLTFRKTGDDQYGRTIGVVVAGGKAVGLCRGL